MTKQEYISRLEKYVSPQAAIFATELFWSEKNLQLVISKARRSKYGDYRPPYNKRRFHKITVNHDLEPNEILVTLLHEYAHYLVHISLEKGYLPHGHEWKNTFRMLLRKGIDQRAFPEHLIPSLIHCYFEQENIASGMCKALKKATGSANNRTYVSDLAENSVFLLQGKVFRKGKRLRTRFECKELNSKKTYRVHGEAVVEHVFSLAELKKLNIHP